MATPELSDKDRRLVERAVQETLRGSSDTLVNAASAKMVSVIVHLLWISAFVSAIAIVLSVISFMRYDRNNETMESTRTELRAAYDMATVRLIFMEKFLRSNGIEIPPMTVSEQEKKE